MLLQNELEKSIRRLYRGQHQLTSTTKIDRYPEIFKAATKLINKKHLNILSYGCSTGEECVSLSEYFPNANIVGADINKTNLAKAKKINSGPNIQYIYSSEQNLSDRGPYDIIFALSVLCRWEDTSNVENCTEIYPFVKFSQSIKLLLSLLQPNGILVVYNANFLIEETEEASYLEPIKIANIKESGFVHKFNKENRKIFPDHRIVFYRKRLTTEREGTY